MRQYHQNNRTHGQNRFERGRDAKMLPSELMHVSVDELLEIAKDKWKSRSLQRSLMENDVQMTELIYEKAEPAFVQLLSDQYGNYLSQKILEHCSDTQFDFLFTKVENKLATLANEVHGTRAVQKFVEEGISRGRTQRILSALIDHVEPLSRSVTGFHVVVKLLEKLSKMTGDVDAVLAKLCYDPVAVVSMAKDQWGCCVLKTCVDKADGERLSFIVEAIVNSTLELVQDPYGNYVVQHVLATTQSYDYVLPQMIERLKDHVLELCQQKFSSNVLEKVLTTAPESHRNMLIEGVLNAGKMDIHSVVQHLLFHQYGNYVLQQTLAVARDPYLTTLIDAIRPYVHSILRHMLEGEGPSSAPIPRRGGTTLAPEQAQRLAVKLGKRFPVLLDGLDEHEKAMLVSPSQWGFRSPTTANGILGQSNVSNMTGLGFPMNPAMSPNGAPGYNAGAGYDYSSLLSANLAYSSYSNPILAALSAGNYNYSAADLAAAAALQSAAGSAAAALGLSAAQFGAQTGSNQAGRSMGFGGAAAGMNGGMGQGAMGQTGGFNHGGMGGPGSGGKSHNSGMGSGSNTMGGAHVAGGGGMGHAAGMQGHHNMGHQGAQGYQGGGQQHQGGHQVHQGSGMNGGHQHQQGGMHNNGHGGGQGMAQNVLTPQNHHMGGYGMANKAQGNYDMYGEQENIAPMQAGMQRGGFWPNYDESDQRGY